MSVFDLDGRLSSGTIRVLDVREEAELQRILVGSGFAATTGMSVGYVLWIARSGVLLSSVLSSMPAWRLIDPIIMGWETPQAPPLRSYQSGNWGPTEADDLLGRHGHVWRQGCGSH